MVRIELAMNKYGAREAEFKYDYDKDVIEIVQDDHDSFDNLDDNDDDDDDALMGLNVIGKSPGKTDLFVNAFHPKICRPGQWVLISEFSLMVQKYPLNSCLKKIGLLPKFNHDAADAEKEIITKIHEFCSKITDDELVGKDFIRGAQYPYDP